MLINTYMNKTKHISVRITEEVKQQLVNEAKKQNVTLTNLILSGVKDEKNKNIFSILS